MPIRYFIDLKLSLVLYICEDKVTGDDFLAAVARAAREPKRNKDLMNSIIDMTNARGNIDLEDVRQAVNFISEKVNDWGFPPKAAIFTKSTGIILLANALNVISGGEVELQSFNCVGAIADWLEFGDQKEELVSFWIDARRSLLLDTNLVTI